MTTLMLRTIALTSTLAGTALSAGGPFIYPQKGSEVRVSEYEVGALLLDVVDGATNELVWRGSAEARIDPSRTPQERTKLIREAVHEMLKHFPPET